MSPTWTTRLSDTLLSTDAHRRIRLAQFLFSLTIYLFSGVVMSWGASVGWLPQGWVALWWLFVLAALALFYGLLRSGWSERRGDPALTEAQIAFGLLTVLWGYLMCGPLRSATLFPMMLILLFGAFSLQWRRMATLTVFGLVGLGACIVALHQTQPGVYDYRVDVSNLLAVSVMLPACSWLATRLSVIRSKLHHQRSDLVRVLAEVQRLATHDELTGLINRRHLTELLTRELLRNERSGQPVCLVLLDIDHFKRVNDTHGHGAGDAVLRAFAAQACASIRACDSLARWGGEEFLLLLPDTSADLAWFSADRLRARTEALRVDAAGVCLQITVSAGVIEYRANEGATAAIARADEALYRAKSQGRNRVEAHRTDVQERAACA